MYLAHRANWGHLHVLLIEKEKKNYVQAMQTKSLLNHWMFQSHYSVNYPYIYQIQCHLLNSIQTHISALVLCTNSYLTLTWPVVQALQKIRADNRIPDFYNQLKIRKNIALCILPLIKRHLDWLVLSTLSPTSTHWWNTRTLCMCCT